MWEDRDSYASPSTYIFHFRCTTMATRFFVVTHAAYRRVLFSSRPAGPSLLSLFRCFFNAKREEERGSESAGGVHAWIFASAPPWMHLGIASMTLKGDSINGPALSHREEKGLLSFSLDLLSFLSSSFFLSATPSQKCA